MAQQSKNSGLLQTIPRVFIDSGASVLLALVKWLVPYKEINALGAEFVYPKPDSLDLLTAAFGSEI